MVATGNVGLAFGLVAAAGAATAIGACVVFCASLAKPRFLAASLGFAAGVMLYVSFAEIVMRKSIDGFVKANYSDIEAYRYATLGFFGGFLIIFILDLLVHQIVHRLEARQKAILANSQSQAVLLDAEDATDNTPGLSSPRSTRAADIEAANLETVEKTTKAVASMAATASSPAEGCNSRCPPSSIVLDHSSKARDDDDDDGEEDSNENNKEISGSRDASEAPAAIMEILKSDPHNFALKKMGILTAIAIFIHNFPEGLLTFSATLADPNIGVGVAVAIALHNAPEGAVIALPIYYATGSKKKALFWAILSGVSEPIGALVGWAAISNGGDLSFAIVFALVGGMMVYISIKELIPMALRYDPKDTVATTAVVMGMAIMAASLLLFTL